MIALWVGAALAGTATLHVGVHREAGTVRDVVADGATGQCVVRGSLLECPAEGPVTFRWGRVDDPWVLWGELTVAPGDTGRAWVFAAEGVHSDCGVRLAGTFDEGVVRDCFVATGESLPPLSLSMYRRLLELVEHEDFTIRRAAIDGLMPLWRHTASDPYPLGSPSLIPEGLVSRLAADIHPRVRRRLASRLRDLNEPKHAEEVLLAMSGLANDRPGLQRASVATLKVQAVDGRIPPVDAWERAMVQVQRPGPPGKAAANTLAALAQVLEAGPDVQPADAVERTLMYQPERAWKVWTAWSTDVGYRDAWVRRLLHETEGWSKALLTSWAETHPDALKEAIQDWEAGEPHSERYHEIHAAMGQAVAE